MTLAEAAVAILTAADPAEKVRLSRAAAEAWGTGMIIEVGRADAPDRPARPTRPVLRAPRDMPRRRAGGAAGRVALLHAIAHIELNAIDLAWDLIARFGDGDWPRGFHDDWVRVGAEEAIHFGLLQDRLGELGAAYGDLPAHDGLWEAAQATARDPLARLAVVPLVLEARGLDVTPAMIEKLERLGDGASAAILRRIYTDEIGHVACGWRWFAFAAERAGLDPVPTWQRLVRQHYKGVLKPPFNDAARSTAGLDPASYAVLA